MLRKLSTVGLNERLLDETFNIEPHMDNSKPVLKKLICVLLLAAIFMGVEIAGGIISHSIAILSDAAHMLSDLLGFVISILSVYISGLPANKKHSYGFHRAGVIGALVSVIVIWALTGFLVYFAVERIINLDEIEVHGKFMFIVACFGLLTNLVMIKILHSGGGHSHGHCHSHGHSPDHNHVHDHGHGHTHSNHNTFEHNHHHGEKLNKDKQIYHLHEQVEKNNYEEEFAKNSVYNHASDHEHQHENILPLLGDELYQSKVYGELAGPQPILTHEKTSKPVGIPISTDNVKQAQSFSHGHKHLSHPSDKDNLNVRATIIHIFGDILQSVGVIIASALIWINPDLKIADPIVTLIFALIVMYTTIQIVKDCIFVLMEGTPAEFNLEEFEAKLNNLEGVFDVHDLHIWSLGVGKPAMSAHLYTDRSVGTILKKVTRLCRSYGIFHSTIQVETTKDKLHEDYFECKHNIH